MSAWICQIFMCFEALRSPTPSRSSVLQRVKFGDALKIYNRIIFNLYLRLRCSSLKFVVFWAVNKLFLVCLPWLILFQETSPQSQSPKGEHGGLDYIARVLPG